MEGSFPYVGPRGTSYYLSRLGGEFPIGNDALKIVPILFALIGDPRFPKELKKEALRIGKGSKYTPKNQKTDWPKGKLPGEVVEGLRQLGIDPKTLEQCVDILDFADGIKRGDLSELSFALDDSNRSSPMNWLYRQFTDGKLADHPVVEDAFVNVYYAPEQARPVDFEILKAAIFHMKPEGNGRIFNLI